MGRTFKVHIDLQIVDGVWQWPKFNIEGVTTEAEYEALTSAYAELGGFLVRAAAKRQSHWMPKGVVRQLHARGDAAEEHRSQWVQLTILEDLDLEPASELDVSPEGGN